jgi:hypothetical protein
MRTKSAGGASTRNKDRRRNASQAEDGSSEPFAKMVAVAVTCEPVSTGKFPANREKNREFYRIAVLAGSETVNNGVVTGLLK